nr:hypothetical protein [Mycobacterium sp. 1423905.2]
MLASLGLLFGGLAVGVAMGGLLPLPYGPAAAVVGYVRAEPVAVQIVATAVFASSVPLAVYAAGVAARLRALGAPGASTTLALVSGALASGALALTGLLGWTLSRADVSADAALVRALYYLAFLIGGPGHVVALGLLVAAIAVPGRRRSLLPGPLAWFGVLVAGTAELTTLVLIWPAVGPLLPVARVSALVWLLVAGALLPRMDLDPV